MLIIAIFRIIIDSLINPLIVFKQNLKKDKKPKRQFKRLNKCFVRESDQVDTTGSPNLGSKSEHKLRESQSTTRQGPKIRKREEDSQVAKAWPPWCLGPIELRPEGPHQVMLRGLQGNTWCC